VFFNPSSSELSAEARAVVNKAAAAIEKRGGKVRLTGVTDDRGDSDVNAKLARSRAAAVRDALVAQGAKADYIIVAKGEEPGTDQARSRRVDIELIA
jgi:outer membrane protein OmpA-like peptidoglycan-associated protein